MTNFITEYADNILIDACGDVPSEEILAQELSNFPQVPTGLSGIPSHIRLHQMGVLHDLHVPTREGIRIATTIDFLIRQSYALRDPKAPYVWRHLYDQSSSLNTRPLMGAVFGVSGCGKTKAIERTLSRYKQVFVHENFPGLVGPFSQLLWLKIDVPGSGKAKDLAEQLMLAFDQALRQPYFSSQFQSSSRSGTSMLHAWLKKAQSQFLGVLVLDEVQNLFKLATAAQRKKHSSLEDRPSLRVVEDSTLRFILTLANTSGIAIFIAGSPDGLDAFSTRFSTTQRISATGFHLMKPIKSTEDPYYRKFFIPILHRYQWLDIKLPLDDELLSQLFHLSAGIPRIISTIWFVAQRYALEKRSKTISIADLNLAMSMYMPQIIPAIEALRSNDPRKLYLYEDIVRNIRTTDMLF